MITWASVRIDFLAIVVSCTDCSSQSLAASRMTMRLLYITISGVSSIDSTIAASTGLRRLAGSSPFCPASASSTKPNSPACARYRPVRKATPGAAPNRRASAVTRPSLNSTGPTSSASTSSHCSATARSSSFMPTVMKNRPSSTS